MTFDTNLKPTIAVVIPAFNEEQGIQKVIRDIPADLVEEIVVVDNNSSDRTKEKAEDLGATLLQEPKQGYGHACLKGIAYLQSKEQKPDMVIFLDADYSDHPDEMEKLIRPIVQDNYDLVIGARQTEKGEKGAMLPQQLFGNWLATRMLKLLYGAKFTDLGPFRAIRYEKLIALNMKDTTYGWTVEMQLKAVKHGLKYCEVPVNYRKRLGISKVSGTVKGTLGAGYKIIFTILKYV